MVLLLLGVLLGQFSNQLIFSYFSHARYVCSLWSVRQINKLISYIFIYRLQLSITTKSTLSNFSPIQYSSTEYFSPHIYFRTYTGSFNYVHHTLNIKTDDLTDVGGHLVEVPGWGTWLGHLVGAPG